MTTRVGWLTDLHLNFLQPPDVRESLCHVERCEHDILLVGGDIGEAPDVVDYLAAIDDALARPVYFVLGNHDFYGGSIRDVRRRVTALCAGRANLRYLTAGGVYPLNADVGLVGHDGWADARLGDYPQSDVMLNDYLLIEELAGHSKEDRRPLLEQLGDEAAAHVRRWLPEALDRFRHVILLTHVPPWREACWHEGQLSNDEWLPHFTCQALGQAIVDIMRNWPQHQLTVLCGHTHSSGNAQPLPNITVHTAGAMYGYPAVACEFEFD